MNDIECEGLRDLHKRIAYIKLKLSADLEREMNKLDTKYITFKGEKCWKEQDIIDIYEADGCTSSECDRAIERLREKKAASVSDKQNRLEFEVEKLRKWLIDMEYDILDYQHEKDLEEQNG